MKYIQNPFIAWVALNQLGAGAYSFWLGDWRIGVINVTVGIANLALSTMQG